jgi:hypothetical protein
VGEIARQRHAGQQLGEPQPPTQTNRIATQLVVDYRGPRLT